MTWAERPLVLNLLPLVAFPLACQAVTGSFSVSVGAHDGGTMTDGASTNESGTGQDATTDGASMDATGDTGHDDASAPTVYNDVTDPSFWSVFDTSSLSANAEGFFGGTFDGRYVYFVPSSYTLAVRYDTQGAFASAASWQTFDTAGINASNVGYRGGAFDGRYVYLVPFYNSTASAGTGVVARFDTQGTFANAPSWATFDTSTVASKAEGFDGTVFDGRYLYFVPHLTGTAARFDTQAPFATASSWATFDATTLSPNAQGFLGGVFDGRYVYLVPNGASEPLTRYDTQGDFTSGAAWTTFDTTTANASAQSFLGGGFDGRYVYLAPFPAGSATTSTVALQYNPAEGLGASSFASFNVNPLGAGSFAGAGFDGQYVYFAPNTSSVIVRYDDTAPGFDAGASWGAFDLSAVSTTASSYYGCVFDGRYMYFVPSAKGTVATVARFDAKTPRSLPQLPGWSGSFL
jgi:hypothetical protein